MFAKKNLVAVAALMAVTGAAQAQSSVKLYGYVEAAFGSYETAHVKGASARTTQVSSGNMMTSFIGFSGSEDLGGGLKAEFALESFLATDSGQYLANNNGATGFWGRASNVALSGGFGKVAIGQYDNPLFTSGYLYNPFGSSMVFSPTMRHYSYLGQTTVLTVNPGVGFDTGWVNSVTYESPVMSGFQLLAQAAPKESTATGAKNSYTVAGSYNAGPLSAMLTYVSGGKSTTPAYSAEEKVLGFGASYDFGALKGFFQYTNIDEKDAGVVGVNGATIEAKTKIYQLGVSVPLSDKLSVLASFGQAIYTPDGTSIDFKDRVFSLGADYALSKRTGAYVAFMNNSQSKTGNDESGQTFAVGIKHSF
jgi:predicted porin